MKVSQDETTKHLSKMSPEEVRQFLVYVMQNLCNLRLDLKDKIKIDEFRDEYKKSLLLAYVEKIQLLEKDILERIKVTLTKPSRGEAKGTV